MNNNNSLAHTSWNCKYHIVFAPKYRRKIFYGEKRAEIGKILRELCNWKGVTVNAKVKMQENAEEILHVFDEKIY